MNPKWFEKLDNMRKQQIKHSKDCIGNNKNNFSATSITLLSNHINKEGTKSMLIKERCF